jgi:hypothetical protein
LWRGNFKARERFRRLTLRFRLHPITAGQAATGLLQRDLCPRKNTLDYQWFCCSGWWGVSESVSVSAAV